MNTVISSLVGLSLLAGFAGPAAAETLAKKKQRYLAAHSGAQARKGSDYYEHIADKLPKPTELRTISLGGDASLSAMLGQLLAVLDRVRPAADR